VPRANNIMMSPRILKESSIGGGYNGFHIVHHPTTTKRPFMHMCGKNVIIGEMPKNHISGFEFKGVSQISAEPFAYVTYESEHKLQS